MAKINLIYASDVNGCIGKNNALPFKIKGDMRFFKSITMGGVVVMGRKTFESVGKPLFGRKNIVISRTPTSEILQQQSMGEIIVFNAIDAKLINYLNNLPESVWIIGGGEIYNQFLPFVDKIYHTSVLCEIDGDTFFKFNSTNYLSSVVGYGSASTDNDFDYFTSVFSSISGS